LTIKNRTDILPGWTLLFDEVSNNVYHVTLTDKFGRQASTTDSDLEKAITTCEEYAFDIEKQISKNWKKFLFDTCLLKTVDKTITKRRYDDDAFGSWYIEYTDKRIVLDGKSFILYNQSFTNGDWVDTDNIKLSVLTFDNFEKAISST
jgi:hypothetical protein